MLTIENAEKWIVKNEKWLSKPHFNKRKVKKIQGLNVGLKEYVEILKREKI